MTIEQLLVEATRSILQGNVFSHSSQFYQRVFVSKPEVIPVETALGQPQQYWQLLDQETEASLPQPTFRSLTNDWIIYRFNIIMDSELANLAFNVEQLAVSHRTLIRKLVSLTRMNASHPMRTYRLRKAAGFLRAGSTVSEAAEKTGFDGLSYFSKLFKAQFFTFPSIYRINWYTSN